MNQINEMENQWNEIIATFDSGTIGKYATNNFDDLLMEIRRLNALNDMLLCYVAQLENINSAPSAEWVVKWSALQDGYQNDFKLKAMSNIKKWDSCYR